MKKDKVLSLRNSDYATDEGRVNYEKALGTFDEGVKRFEEVMSQFDEAIDKGKK